MVLIPLQSEKLLFHLFILNDFFFKVAKQIIPGARVVRGPDWKWRNQDGHRVGTVNAPIQNGK